MYDVHIAIHNGNSWSEKCRDLNAVKRVIREYKNDCYAKIGVWDSDKKWVYFKPVLSYKPEINTIGI